MLYGRYEHTVDAKNRMFVPAKYREELGETFVIFRSIRGNYIKMLSLGEWENYIAPIKALPRKDAEETLRFLNRNAAMVSPDAQGRIVLTPSLIEHASIAKGAVVVGCGAYAEIWAEEVYDAKLLDEDLDDIRATLESFGL